MATKKHSSMDHFDEIGRTLGQAKAICALVGAADESADKNALPDDTVWRVMQLANELIESAEAAALALYRAPSEPLRVVGGAK